MEKLLDKLHAIDEKRAVLKAEAMLVQAEIDRLTAEQAAQKTFDRMSDTERAALAQLVKANGIESQESVKGLAG